MFGLSMFRRGRPEELCRLRATAGGTLYALSTCESDEGIQWSCISILQNGKWKRLKLWPEVWIRDFVVTDDGSLYCVSADNELDVWSAAADKGWDARTATPEKVNILAAVHVSSGGTLLIAGDRGRIWNDTLQTNLETNVRTAISAFCDYDGNVYAVGERGLFGRVDGDRLQRISTGITTHLNSLCATAHGLVLAGDEGAIIRWSEAAGCRTTQVAHWDIIAVAPLDERSLVCAGEEVLLLKGEDALPIEVPIGDSFPIDAVSIRGDQVAVGLADMRVYGYPSGKRLA